MKRLFDIVITAVTAPIWLPLMMVIACMVLVKLGRPVLFSQTRCGMHGRPFRIVKFRSMRDALDAHGNPLPDVERLSKFGTWLRGSSLDELPELWNVLRGEMSLVGPRPLLMDYLPLYSPEQARRHEVRPGITGWAQVNGRNALGWEEKFNLDVWYVDNRSLWLDCRILVLTLIRVAAREGISPTDQAIMPRFRGSPCSHGGRQGCTTLGNRQ